MNQYYQTLGLSPGASKRDVQRAYRALCKRFHPDAHSSEASTKRFREVRKAYEKIQAGNFQPKSIPSAELLGQMEYFQRRMARSARLFPGSSAPTTPAASKTAPSVVEAKTNSILDTIVAFKQRWSSQEAKQNNINDTQTLRVVMKETNRIPASEIGRV